MVASINFLFAVVYVFVLSYALVSDFRRLIIPNWCSITLVVAFLPFAAINLSLNQFVLNLTLSLVVLTLGFIFYNYAWFGAGDVKLLSAVMLWVGVSKAVPFAMVIALVGFLLASALIFLRRILHVYPDQFSRRGWLRQPIAWVEKGAFPYGLAIGGAGLAYVPAIFVSGP